MKRRNFVSRTLFLSTGLAVTYETEAATLKVDPQQQANEFSQAYNIWATMRRDEGTLNVQEIRAWREVKRTWKELEKMIRYDS